MQLTVNGKMFDTEKKSSVIDLRIEKKINSPEILPLELNDLIIHQDDFSKTKLKENDRVEFLYFMGGGQRRHERIKL